MEEVHRYNMKDGLCVDVGEARGDVLAILLSIQVRGSLWANSGWAFFGLQIDPKNSEDASTQIDIVFKGEFEVGGVANGIRYTVVLVSDGLSGGNGNWPTVIIKLQRMACGTRHEYVFTPTLSKAELYHPIIFNAHGHYAAL